MRYCYTVTYSIKGISHRPDAGDRELVVDPGLGLRAFITAQPNPYVFEGDRSLAVASLMLRALFRAEPASDEFTQRVSKAVEEIRAAREKEFGSNPFLVMIAEGDVPSFEPSHQKDAVDFIVGFDGVDKAE